eukprot:Blabericola_migrator_1__507@NODE_1122_length_5377_cov_95_501695_g478_i5_p3_GENE_NODE_1122_length_5377_cov_95_501695_g478_i5NODE_1122_length_5377_cov_95_501695_g478_i5_p3_ORF_typecomplete_len144_score4_78rve/PF00665_26/1_6e07rve_3/PF13683_6/2_4e03rve_3/PF13683_6/0_0023_NODE_1122_length_5377_cov_95_501695_g478_i541024533
MKWFSYGTNSAAAVREKDKQVIERSVGRPRTPRIDRYLQGVCREFGIRQSFSAPYHPQSNGIPEEFHQNLNWGFNVYNVHVGWDFDTKLNTVLYAVRPILHSHAAIPHTYRRNDSATIPGLWALYWTALRRQATVATELTRRA